MKIPQSEIDLKKQLDEQINFIKKSCAEFDGGEVSEAKRIALSIRILLHDTRRSTSLLNSLGDKSKIFFLDSAFSFNPHNLAPHQGLVIMECNADTVHTKVEYKPLLGTHISMQHQEKWIPFTDWWQHTVIKDQKGNLFSRKDLILHIADTDGGAHIDKDLDQNYVDLSRNNSTGFYFAMKLQGGEEHHIALKNIELASVRQIGFEIIQSLIKYDNIKKS